MTEMRHSGTTNCLTTFYAKVEAGEMTEEEASYEKM